MAMNFINFFRNRIRERMLLLSISHLLEKIGLKIVPYYLTREYFLDKIDLNLTPGIKPVSCEFLSPHETKDLYSLPEIKNLADEVDKWLSNGCPVFRFEV
jgi:hypothetical protein